jgi:hypothetical protein
MTQYVPPVLHVPVELLVVALLVGAALLAGWTATRFEHVRPRTLGGSLLAGGAGLVLMTGLGDLSEAILAFGGPDVRPLIALGIVLPVFTFFFLSLGWVLRAVLDLLEGAH